MFSARHTALYAAMSAMAMVGSEANAKYVTSCGFVGGIQVCSAKWVPGSEVCQVTVDTTQDGRSPQSVTCTVKGASYDPGDEPPYSCNGNNIPGKQTCSSTTTILARPAARPAPPTPPCLYNKYSMNPACGTPDINGELTNSGPFTCAPSGICTATVSILPPAGSMCSNPPGGTLTDFTASQFIGIIDIFYAQPGPAPNITLYEYCVLNSPGTVYDCVDVTNDIDQYSCIDGGEGY